MKIRHFLLISFLFLSACKMKSHTVVVAGDSWGFFVCAYQSLDMVFEKNGIKNAGANPNCVITTRIGMRASNWLGSPFDKATRQTIVDESVEILYLSLGGNDVLNGWNKSMSPQEEDILFDTVIENLKNTISDYQELNPKMKILISGYDFPRFIPNNPIKEYKEIFEMMGSPTPLEINSMLLRFSDHVSQLRDQKSIFYIQHYGVMQFYFGSSEYELLPGTTLSPDYISTPELPDQSGGDSRYLSDPAAMLRYEAGVVDAFHLSKDGYEKLADHATQMYFKKWLEE